MTRTPHRVVCLALAVLAIGVAGCVQQAPKKAALEAPIIEPEPLLTQDNTILERFKEVSTRYEAEKNNSALLQDRLEETATALEAARSEVEELRGTVKGLEKKQKGLDALNVKYDEAQKALLDLGNNLRTLRRDLYTEKLARVKAEQTIVKLRIDIARNERSQLLARRNARTKPPASGRNKENVQDVKNP